MANLPDDYEQMRRTTIRRNITRLERELATAKTEDFCEMVEKDLVRLTKA